MEPDEILPPSDNERLGAIALWVGGSSAFLVTLLQFTALSQPDGSLFALTGSDYGRWMIFPTLVLLHGLSVLHVHQREAYGLLGRIGFLVTFAGYSLFLAGHLWAAVLIPPTHPFWFVGPNLRALGVLIAISGWILWGTASATEKSLPSWAVPAPLIMASVWVVARFFLADVINQTTWMRDGPLIQLVHAAGFAVLGLVLWRARAEDTTARRPVSASAN